MYYYCCLLLVSIVLLSDVTCFELHTAGQDPEHDRLVNVPADRALPGTIINFSYSILSKEAAATFQSPNDYNQTMQTFHGVNIWKDPKLFSLLQFLGLEKGELYFTSPIRDMSRLEAHMLSAKPTIFLELGVFQGTTSIAIARMFHKLSQIDSHFKKSFVISIDSWLLDIKFKWNKQQKMEVPAYLKGTTIAGHDLMYFSFLANCLVNNVSHLIVPMQSATSNAIYSLINHGIHPDIVYLDASHANPDVFVDLEGVWTVLNKRGLVICDDYNMAPVHTAVDFFLKRHASEVSGSFVAHGQMWIHKNKTLLQTASSE